MAIGSTTVRHMLTHPRVIFSSVKQEPFLGKKNILLMIIADNEVSRDIKDVDLLNYVEMDPQISF